MERPPTGIADDRRRTNDFDPDERRPTVRQPRTGTIALPMMQGSVSTLTTVRESLRSLAGSAAGCGSCRSRWCTRGPAMLLVSHNVQQRGHEHDGCYVNPPPDVVWDVVRPR